MVPRAGRRVSRLALVLPFLYMAFLFGLSSIPGGEHEILGYSFELSPGLGNFLHLPAYFVLGVLWKFAFAARGVPERKGTLLAVVLGTAFGVSDEVHQFFVPRRYMDVRDVIADFIGLVLAGLAWPLLRPLLARFLVAGGAPVPALPASLDARSAGESLPVAPQSLTEGGIQAAVGEGESRRRLPQVKEEGE
jgi:hypothetical protein